MSTTPTPSRPLCGGPTRCRGILIPGHPYCLAHLGGTERQAYLASLGPGAEVDLRGTPLTPPLLEQVLDALTDPVTGVPSFGRAHFGDAQFDGDADFKKAEFTGRAEFERVHFNGSADFSNVLFRGAANFMESRFNGDAWFGGAIFDETAIFMDADFSERTTFGGARFTGEADFLSVKFSGESTFGGAEFLSNAIFSRVQFLSEAWFRAAQFIADALFDEAQFSGQASFGGVQFHDNAKFQLARFAETSLFGPFVCENVVALWGTVFEAPVTLEIAAYEVQFIRTQWESTATVRLRYATADLSQAVLSAPVAVVTHHSPFTTATAQVVDETHLLHLAVGARLSSIQGVDAAHLVLTDIDLTECLFSGAFHLDQLRLEGRTTFASVPTGWHRRGILPARWTRRRTLAEEHHWRAQAAGQDVPPRGILPSPRQWRPGPHHPAPELTPDPEDVVALYRQLRKAFEDGKNEPGAADFYYGEMEMRRHDRVDTPRVERALLHIYWFLSGYGLRASRALVVLAAAMAITILVLMSCGLPQHTPAQEATGTVPVGGGHVTLTIDKDDPQNPTGDRFTGKRFDQALNVTLNSVIFRSSGQDLTTTGTYTEMASRLLEPALLALAVLAVRGRIKR
ncbi:pentapeptide repeat-containing protein [Streptomyces sp. NPDC004237]|uniref:pentapeptide repeat-containing protein n=1 Tax=Streptomyces sp. NPDC004237 TaxID=3154455 RepID=UPI0033B30584